MKKQKTIEQPVMVYQNKDFENQTRQELETARKALQMVLNKWLSLELGPCSNISDLIFRPKIMYDQAVSDLIKVPEFSGPFKLDKSKYQEQFTLPDPIELLNARNIALKQSFCALPELWDIKDNEVVLNESEAFVYIHSQSIYANDPKQIEFCNQLDTFVKLFTKIDTSLKGKFSQPTPFTYQFCRGKFEVKETENSFYEIKIIPEILRTWLRDLK